MKITNVITILLSATSVVAGAFLGAVRSKLFAEKTRNKFHWIFYIIGGALILSDIIYGFIFYKQIFNPFNFFNFIVLFLAFCAGLSLILFTRKYLIVKTIYTVPELDPIINDFTNSADLDEIRLFGGDLNFFGNTPADVDLNSQYAILRARKFQSVLILCEEPVNTTQEIRYGKICHDIKNVKLAFYDPKTADLKVRGRIIKIQGIIRLLMYTKQSDGIYETVATDTSNTKGLLYDNIWHLTWSLAKTPSQQQIQNYIAAFNAF